MYYHVLYVYIIICISICISCVFASVGSYNMRQYLLVLYLKISIEHPYAVTGTQTTSHLETFWEVPRREAWSHVESEPQPTQHLRIILYMFVHCGNDLRFPTSTKSVRTLRVCFPCLELSCAAERCNLVHRWPWCAHWRRSFWLWGLGFRSKELACQNQCRRFDDQQTVWAWLGIGFAWLCNVFERTPFKLSEIPARRP